MHRVWIAILVVSVSLFRMAAMAEQPRAIQEVQKAYSAGVPRVPEIVSTRKLSKPSGSRQVTTLQTMFAALETNAICEPFLEVTQNNLAAQGTTDFPYEISGTNFPEIPKKVPKSGISS